MPATRSVIIDCDAGQDDAINLLLAMAVPEAIDILGITVVAGNVPLALTQRNVRLICDIAGRPDIPVFAGSAAPLRRPLVTAEYVHGVSGLDGVVLFEPVHPLQSVHAVDFIVETLRAAIDDGITLILTGPLTNIALAFDRDPAIAAKVADIVVMGGARRECGNFTPSAEFNVHVDPHAADAVLRCGRPITLIGLDATYQVRATPARRERIRAIDNRPARVIAGILDHAAHLGLLRYGAAGTPLHDPCTIAWLLAPELFAGKLCNISVETASELTMGHTAIDVWEVTGKPPNATWIDTVDAAGVFDLLVDCLHRYDRC